MTLADLSGGTAVFVDANTLVYCSVEKPRSHALRGNASLDAPRPGENASAAVPYFPRRRASHPCVPTQSVGTRSCSKGGISTEQG